MFAPDSAPPPLSKNVPTTADSSKTVYQGAVSIHIHP